MRKITIDPVTRIEGHAKIDHPPGRRRQRRRHPVPRDPGARLREIHRRPAVLRDARDHRAHLRHLPGQPPAGLGQGLRRHHGGTRFRPPRVMLREADSLRADRAVPCAQLLPSLGARPAAGHGFRPGAPQHLRPDRRSTRDGARRNRPAQVRAASHRAAGRRARASRRGSCPAASIAARCRRDATHPRRSCPRRAAIARRTLDLFKSMLDGFPRRSPRSARCRRCMRAWWTPTAACSCTRAHSLQDPRPAPSWPEIDARAVCRVHRRSLAHAIPI